MKAPTQEMDLDLRFNRGPSEKNKERSVLSGEAKAERKERRTRRQILGSSDSSGREVIRSGERMLIALKMESHFSVVSFWWSNGSF